MAPEKRDLASRVALLASIVGLGASLAAAVDDLGGAPAFCAESGCEIVRSSAWARPLGIPMSLLGIAFFASAIVLAHVRLPRLRRALAVAGGAFAIVLVGVQAFAIGAWCKLCLVADPAAIVYAIAVIASRVPAPFAFSWARTAATVPALAAVAGVLALWTSTPAPSAPTSAPAELAQAGELTVVEYVDFECPFCRVMQRRLDEAIAKAARPVKIVRKMVPIEQHRGALIAALAWCIADAQGQGDAMARALFAADPAQLTRAGCEALAAQLGIDAATFAAGLPAAEARVRADVAEASRIGIGALPTLFVGHERFVGAAASTRELLAALDRAGA